MVSNSQAQPCDLSVGGALCSVSIHSGQLAPLQPFVVHCLCLLHVCAYAMQCSFCGMSDLGLGGASGVQTGLAANEMVLRGGSLSAPLVLDDVVIVAGRRFVRLRKAHDGLCRFLCGKSSHGSPLARTQVFETLRARRDDQVRAMCQEFLGFLAACRSLLRTARARRMTPWPPWALMRLRWLQRPGLVRQGDA